MILTMAVSAAVAVLVVFLKPIADDWSDRRKKRIRFRLDRPNVIKTPIPNIKLKFGDYEFDELYGYDAEIINGTNRTIRKLSFDFTASPGKPADGFCFATSGTQALNVTEEGSGKSKWLLEFDELPRGRRIPLHINSTVPQEITLKTQEDYEIYTVTAGLNSNIRRIGAFKRMLEAGSIAAVLAALSGMIFNILIS
jgi:hypothetical protein